MYHWHRPREQQPAVGMLGGRFPEIVIGATAEAKMEALVACCNIECSWVTTTQEIDGDYHIEDVFVPPQVCTFGSTIFREHSLLSPFMANDGKISREHFPLIEKMHGWGHSHHRMGVWASTTDDNQAANFINQLQDYFIRLICNKRGDINVTLYLINRGLVLHHPIIRHETDDLADESLLYDNWAIHELETKVRQAHWRPKKKRGRQVPNPVIPSLRIGREQWVEPIEPEEQESIEWP